MQDIHSIVGNGRFFAGTGAGGGDRRLLRPQNEQQQQSQNLNLKCPRCESANTKFCYYNNYNLSQPRHFCKNCRRYWTKGGVLRNVPVGGGCRKNKRSANNSSSKSSKSKLRNSSSSSDSHNNNNGNNDNNNGNNKSSSESSSLTVTNTTAVEIGSELTDFDRNDELKAMIMDQSTVHNHDHHHHQVGGDGFGIEIGDWQQCGSDQGGLFDDLTNSVEEQQFWTQNHQWNDQDQDQDQDYSL